MTLWRSWTCQRESTSTSFLSMGSGSTTSQRCAALILHYVSSLIVACRSCFCQITRVCPEGMSVIPQPLPRVVCVCVDCLFCSQRWPASSAPSTTWSRWRSQTLRCSTRCRSTLWSAQTRQVGHSSDVTVWVLNVGLKGDFCSGADLSSSPPGPYGQEQYMCRPEEHLKAPPILPPHLLQVILNKDTNISVGVSSPPPLLWSRSVLVLRSSPLSLFLAVWSRPAAWTQSCHAQPPLRSLHKGTHSVNHQILILISCLAVLLYGCCAFLPCWHQPAGVVFLQDGVMVLSATHRYKKKYVTSLLYKPI